MSVTLIVLIALICVACAAAALSLITIRERRELLGRVEGAGTARTASIAILRQPDATLGARVGSWIRDRAPESWADAGEARDALVHAGYDGPLAPVVYSTIRLGTLLFLPLIGFLLAPKDNPVLMMGCVGVGLAMGLIGPRAVLDRLAAQRRDRIRRSLPDCLDLMVVCVEAGISLDAAMLRVARDMGLAHPELAAELLVVNRRMNAGITRDEAVSGLWRRTGLEDLRALTSSIIQSERLGTSIARVLRVYAETLRRKRKQAAEKRAAEAALKMIIPLGIFMLPALFSIILGPAMLRAQELLKALQN